MMNKRFLAVMALVAIIAILPSCGKKVLKTDEVTGTVTLDGSPLKGCTVFFTPAEGNGAPAVGTTDASGVYKLQTALGAADAGTTPGDYTVHFTCLTVVKEGQTGDKDGEGATDDETKSAIPAKYNDPKKSGFTATVVKGQPNKFDFALTSK